METQIANLEAWVKVLTAMADEMRLAGMAMLAMLVFILLVPRRWSILIFLATLGYCLFLVFSTVPPGGWLSTTIPGE